MNIEQMKTLQWADVLIYSLLDPRAMYRCIRDRLPFRISFTFIIPAMVSLSELVAISLVAGRSGFISLAYGWIFLFLIFSISIIVTTSLMDLSGQFLGFKGNAKELIAVVNLSLFPKIFLLPAVYIFVIIDFAPAFFYCFFSFVLFIWSSIIVVLGISEMHRASFGNSLFVYFFPVLLFGLAVFFSTVLLMVGLFQLIF